MLGSGRNAGARGCRDAVGGRYRRSVIGLVALTALTLPLAISTTPATAAPSAPGDGWPTISVPNRTRPADSSHGEQGISVSRNQDGRLEAFCACGPVSALRLMHTYQVAPNSGWAPWNDWGPLATIVDPHVVMNRDGRLEVFFGNIDGIVHAWQLWPGGPWGPLTQLTTTGRVNGVAATRHPDGRIELFFQCGTCSTAIVGHLWQRDPGGAWSEAEPLSPTPIPVGSVTAFQDSNGDVEFLGYASGSPLVFLAKWSASTGGGWYFTTVAAPSLSIYGDPNTMAVGINADGRAEVFLSTTTGAYNMWQTSPNGTWSGLSKLTAASNFNVSVGRNPDGRLELFFAPSGGSSVALHQWQLAPGSSWSDPAPLTNTTTAGFGAALATVNDADGRLETFFVAVAAAPSILMLHAWQMNVNLGPWSALVPL